MKNETDIRCRVQELMQRLMLKTGIRAVKVDELARSLGISKRTIYELYPDKRELIVCSMRTLFDGWRREVEASLACETDSYLRLLRAIEGYLRIHNAMCVTLQIEFDRYGDRIVCYREWHEWWRKLLVESLDSCRAEGYCLAEISAENTVQSFFAIHRCFCDDPVRYGARMDYLRWFVRGVSTSRGVAINDRFYGRVGA